VCLQATAEAQSTRPVAIICRLQIHVVLARCQAPDLDEACPLLSSTLHERDGRAMQYASPLALPIKCPTKSTSRWHRLDHGPTVPASPPHGHHVLDLSASEQGIRKCVMTSEQERPRRHSVGGGGAQPGELRRQRGDERGDGDGRRPRGAAALRWPHKQKRAGALHGAEWAGALRVRLWVFNLHMNVAVSHHTSLS
jgi:hypothetical protein